MVTIATGRGGPALLAAESWHATTLSQDGFRSEDLVSPAGGAEASLGDGALSIMGKDRLCFGHTCAHLVVVGGQCAGARRLQLRARLSTDPKQMNIALGAAAKKPARLAGTLRPLRLGYKPLREAATQEVQALHERVHEALAASTSATTAVTASAKCSSEMLAWCLYPEVSTVRPRFRPRFLRLWGAWLCRSIRLPRPCR